MRATGRRAPARRPTRPRPAVRARRTTRLWPGMLRVEQVRVPDHPRERPQVPVVGVGELLDRRRAVREDHEFGRLVPVERSQTGEVDEGTDAERRRDTDEVERPTQPRGHAVGSVLLERLECVASEVGLRAARVRARARSRPRSRRRSTASRRLQTRSGAVIAAAAHVPETPRRSVRSPSNSRVRVERVGQTWHESLHCGRATRDDNEVNQPPAPIALR